MTRTILTALMAVLVLGGCRERLTVPGQCPDQCPGGTLVIRDTVLDAIESADSSFSGYVGFHDAAALLLAQGSTAGESHAIVTFAGLPETYSFAGQEVAYEVDSIRVSIGLISRDTLVKAPRLLLYRFPVDIDSTMTFQEAQSLFDAGTPIDTLVVPDSLLIGGVDRTYSGDDLNKFLAPPADSGRLAFGIRLDADEPTGLRIGARLTENLGPTLIYFLTIDAPDTLFRKQFFAPDVRYAGMIRDTERVTDPDLLVVGGMPAHRAIIRFALPPAIEQAGSVLRATLELTPSRPYYGLEYDGTLVDVRGVVVDLGYKSVPIGTGASAAVVPISGEAVLEVEVASIVNIWRSEPLVPRLFYLSAGPEGHAFAEPVFYSTRSPVGRPRLRITYTVPARLETP
ncbi:MAG TPA: hypothetical protein VMK53_09370 [Gemmatimonadales bacterium]|nr:hypothetical protein [Gemmatimonadales bacterium]